MRGAARTCFRHPTRVSPERMRIGARLRDRSLHLVLDRAYYSTSGAGFRTANGVSQAGQTKRSGDDMPTDEDYMRMAIEEARAAARKGEVPVGAVVVRGGKVLARAHNMRETMADPTAHAEILALRQAAEKRGTWRLEGVTVYCSLEPCAMCAGALVNARVDRLVFGPTDEKSGACGTVVNLLDQPAFNHRVDVRGGVLEEEALEVLQQFFREKRD